MTRLPSPPQPWKSGDPLTAKHLDYNRNVLAELIRHKAPVQEDEPPQDADETSAIGEMSYIAKQTREEVLTLTDDAGSDVGTVTIEITTAVQVRDQGTARWIYLE